MRKIFLDNLHKRGSTIDWRKNVGLKVNFIYDSIIGEIKILEYDIKTQKIKIEYNEKVHSISTSNFIKCRLSKILGFVTSDFKANIGDTFNDNDRDIVVIDKKIKNGKNSIGDTRNTKYYKYKCNKCGNVDWKEEYSLLVSKTGCSHCGTFGGKALIEGITDIPTAVPWMVKYFQGGYDEAKLYTKNSNKKIRPICPDCGKIKDKPTRISDIYRLKSIGCSCGDGKSYGEKIMASLLEQLKLDFRQEVKFDWCVFPKYKNIDIQRTGYYDFVIDELDIIVEIDGKFHLNDNDMSGQSKEESKYIDYTKDKLAQENGYKVIRISCLTTSHNEIKHNIINSSLSDLFDLSKIDWVKCEEFAMTNLLKNVAEYWNSKKEYETTKDIANLFRISEMSVRNYLKRATKIGLTNYDPKIELIKAGKKSSALNNKKIEIFKNNVSLGVYNSVLELANSSEKDLGCRLVKSCVSRVARGERNHYKGYTFKYV